MTLCIAAICQDRFQPRIIISSDFQQETGYAGGEISDKLMWLDKDMRWAALIADSGGSGTQFVDTLRSHFEGKAAIRDADVTRFLEDGVFAHRRRMIDQFFRDTYGLTYDDILANGLPAAGKRFPDKFIEDKLIEVESIILDAQLLVVGFSSDGMPCIFVVNEDVTSKRPLSLRREYNFAAIGSGAPAANLNLYRREHTYLDHFMNASYHVYETMTLSGAVVPGVGSKYLPIDILLPDGPPESVSDDGFKYLAKLFRKYGPKTIPNSTYFDLKPCYVEEFTCNDYGGEMWKGAHQAFKDAMEQMELDNSESEDVSQTSEDRR